MFIRLPEAHSRSFVKAVSWRLVGSLDTFAIVWITTGKLQYAGVVIGVETVTKIIIYYLHEQLWGWLPWWRSEKQVSAATRAAQQPAPGATQSVAAPSV